VLPLLHKYEDAALAVMVTFDPQVCAEAGDITAVIGVLIVTVVAADTAVHPPAFVTVTV